MDGLPRYLSSRLQKTRSSVRLTKFRETSNHVSRNKGRTKLLVSAGDLILQRCARTPIFRGSPDELFPNDNDTHPEILYYRRVEN